MVIKLPEVPPLTFWKFYALCPPAITDNDHDKLALFSDTYQIHSLEKEGRYVWATEYTSRVPSETAYMEQPPSFEDDLIYEWTLPVALR